MALTGGEARRRALLCAALLLLVGAVFLPTLRHDWINYDDDIYITANPELTRGLGSDEILGAFTSFQGANWFPLTRLSWMLDHAIHGLDAGAFHATNLWLHALASLALFLALARATGSPWRSAFVAAVFAVHPLHVEPVAWAAARKDPLSGLCFALLLLVYAGGGRGPRSAARMLAVSTLLALGLMSKPTLVSAPLLLLLFDAWPLGRLRGGAQPHDAPGDSMRAVLLEKLPLFALAAGASALTLLAQHGAGTVVNLDQLPLPARLENAAVAGVSYLGKSVWPRGLAVFYPHPEQGVSAWRLAGSLALLLAVTALALRSARRHPALAMGWLWYLLALAPVIGVVQVGSQAMADRYMYLPLIGLAIVVAWGAPELLGAVVGDARRRRALLGLAAGASVALLAGTAILQVRHWRDSVALFEHTLSVTRDNSIAHAHLGAALLERGEVDSAIAHWREAARLRPGFRDVTNNLAWLLATAPDPRHRDPDLAIRLAERAARGAADDTADVLDTLAAAYAAAGRFEEAVAAEEQAIMLAERAGRKAAASEFRRRLLLYRARRPYVEEPSGAAARAGVVPSRRRATTWTVAPLRASAASTDASSANGAPIARASHSVSRVRNGNGAPAPAPRRCSSV